MNAFQIWFEVLKKFFYVKRICNLILMFNRFAVLKHRSHDLHKFCAFLLMNSPFTCWKPIHSAIFWLGNYFNFVTICAGLSSLIIRIFSFRSVKIKVHLFFRSLITLVFTNWPFILLEIHMLHGRFASLPINDLILHSPIIYRGECRWNLTYGFFLIWLHSSYLFY